MNNNKTAFKIANYMHFLTASNMKMNQYFWINQRKKDVLTGTADENFSIVK